MNRNNDDPDARKGRDSNRHAPKVRRPAPEPEHAICHCGEGILGDGLGEFVHGETYAYGCNIYAKRDEVYPVATPAGRRSPRRGPKPDRKRTVRRAS